MKKLFVFVGDGGSGKTTLIAELTKRYPDKFRKVVTCTSRLMRVGEVAGEDYHFLPVEHFADNPELVLVKKTENGDYYGTRKGDLQSDTYHPLLTLRFAGIRRLADLRINNVAVVRVLITDDLKIERMRQRGDAEETIICRLQFDIADRVDIDWEGLEIIDLQAADPLAEKVEQILKAC
jgi:guanylate kinase